MRPVTPLAELENQLAEARAAAAGSATELAAIVELAYRLTRDQRRRGELASEGVELAERLGDEVAQLRCRAMVAETVARMDRPTAALPDALRIVAAAERCGQPQVLAQAYHTLAFCFHALDCDPEALLHSRRARSGYQRAGDLFGEARVGSLMGVLAERLGERARAVELYQRAHDIFVECDDAAGAGLMLADIAACQHADGDLVRAADTSVRALELFDAAGNPQNNLIAMLHYAKILADLGQPDAAALWAKRAAQHNRRPDGTPANRGHEISILITTAEAVQIRQGDLDAARATLEQAVRMADRQGALGWAAKAESLLAGVLRAAGDLASAYDHLQRSAKLTEERTRASHDQRVRALRVLFDLEQAQWDATRYRDRAQAQAQVIAELESTKIELAVRMAELERLNAEMLQLSRTDPLTGMANRRFMRQRLIELGAATGRYGTLLAVAVFDIDQFKYINDRYGHATGDTVLVTIAELTRVHIRSVDLPARLGGDEFVIIMPSVRGTDAVSACRRLHAAIRGYPWAEVVAGLSVTITVGVADATGQTDPDEILRRADAALYRGKHAGRDRVIGWVPEMEPASS